MPDPRNAIVLMFDSLQFNYLGCYGNHWIKTPHFDRLAREGALFENCYIEGLPTVPCRRAMLTGRYTLPVAGWVPLSMEDTTIADLCWGRPIDTAIVFDCAPMRMPKFGYTRGFDKVWFTHGHEADDFFYSRDPLYHETPDDYVEEHFVEQADSVKGLAVVEPLKHELGCYLKQTQYWRTAEDRYVARTMRKAIAYLEQADRNKSFFLWIDSFDPHEPWNPPSVYRHEPCPYDPDYTGKAHFLPLMGDVDGLYTAEELHHVRMLYAELVSLCDHYLGELMDAMRRLGLERNTLFMTVSDHGEPMGYGEHGHGIMRKCRPWPYEELAHGVMLLRAPGVPAGRRVSAFVQSVDVAPTVCEWLGIGVHPDMQGKSLLALARGETDKVRDFAVAGYCKYSWAIMTEEWSYIHWLRSESTAASNASYMANFFQKEVARTAASLVTDKGSALTQAGANSAGSVPNASALLESEEGRRYREAASLDGEEQWTCTPGSRADVPEQDELYERRADPFQLRNVIDEHRDKAAELLNTLRGFMAGLAAGNR